MLRRKVKQGEGDKEQGWGSVLLLAGGRGRSLEQKRRTAVLKNRAKWAFLGRGGGDGRINLKCKDSKAGVCYSKS